jgi:hypothetical protein
MSAVRRPEPSDQPPAKTPMIDEFPRIKRLPPYVFNIVNDLKAKARARGEDIIDFGMGNPDQATPKHIVDKLVEVAQRDGTHRYSMSRGIPRLRRAVTRWYKDRFDVDLDPERPRPSSPSVPRRGWRTWRWPPWVRGMRYWSRTRPIPSIPTAA